MSLDGYIADENGKVAWLDNYNSDKSLENYNKFIENIGCVVLGYNTYNQIVQEFYDFMRILIVIF